MDQEMLTTAQVAPMIGYTHGSLIKLRQRGGGPKFYRLGYKTVRYRREDVEAWIESRREDVA